MDLATIGGLVIGFGLVLFGTLVAGLSPLDIFDLPSVFITIGGGLSASVVASPLSRLLNFTKYTRFALFPRQTDVGQLILTLVSFSERARREGLLSLEDDLVSLEEPFLRKGIQLVVDGTDPELVRNILDTDMQNIHNRHEEGVKLWNDLGFFLPAFGMIGTLIGLVQMLANLQDTETISPAMAVALLTTFYGAILGTAVLSPMAAKLERNSNEEAMLRTLIMIAMSSIARQDNPRRLEMLLNSELPPSERIKYFD